MYCWSSIIIKSIWHWLCVYIYSSILLIMDYLKKINLIVLIISFLLKNIKGYLIYLFLSFYLLNQVEESFIMITIIVVIIIAILVHMVVFIIIIMVIIIVTTTIVRLGHIVLLTITTTGTATTTDTVIAQYIIVTLELTLLAEQLHVQAVHKGNIIM